MSQLLNPKIQEAIFPYTRGKITCGVHLRGSIGEVKADEPMAMPSIFDTGSVDDSTEEDNIINTFIYIDPQSKAFKQSVDNKWLTGEQKTFNVDAYPETIQKGIIGSLNKVKGIFKGANVRPIEPELFEEMVKSDPQMQKITESLLATFELMVTQIQTEKQKYSSIGVEAFIDRYAFRKHIMILGAKGGGKTYTVSNYCEENNIHTNFIAGHNGLEATDLLGYYVKNTEGALVWMDGPLSAAFRKAQTDKSVLFIDEILRIPSRELNILIGALTPDSTGHYLLRTNRIIDEMDGMGESETLKVPVENLWAVSTTNIGADYDTEDMDLALTDRFRMVDMKVSASSIMNIMEACNDGKFPESTLEKMLNLYTAVAALVQTKELTYSLNVRHLCEIIQLCDDEKDMASYFYDLTANVCSRTTDGDINEVEENIFKNTVKKLI